jgi:hypothetical protein
MTEDKKEQMEAEGGRDEFWRWNRNTLRGC